MLPLLAQLAAMVALEGGKKYLGDRSAKQTAKRQQGTAALNAATSALAGQSAPQRGMPGYQSENPMDYTQADEMMQQKLWQSIFGNLLGGGPKVGGAR